MFSGFLLHHLYLYSTGTIFDAYFRILHVFVITFDEGPWPKYCIKSKMEICVNFFCLFENISFNILA